jgi:hypothetical protein
LARWGAEPMEPEWQIMITTKPLNFTKMRQSLTGPPLNNTARAITQRAWSIQRVRNNTRRVQINKATKPTPKANNKSS